MENETKARERLEQLLSTSQCPREFRCYKSNFQDLPNINYLEGPDLIECMEKDVQNCENSYPFGDSFFCKCPALNYFFSELRKQ